ncbi:MAG: hypothetical protein C0505_14415 [Leptothrix sp. (in: Bacteria)]|nr:hypothetical protein [Leptothrix sp. (in: b-proteobacteria)]
MAGDLDRALVAAHLAVAAVDAQWAAFERLAAAQFAAASQGLAAPQQFVTGKGLERVVISARSKAEPLVRERVAGRQHEYRHVAAVAGILHAPAVSHEHGNDRRAQSGLVFDDEDSRASAFFHPLWFSMSARCDKLSLLKYHRRVDHKGAATTHELAPLMKSIYSLIDLRENLLGCNQRCLAFLSSLDDPSAGERDLQRLRQPRAEADPSVKGLNSLNAADPAVLQTLQHGEFNIHGWRRTCLPSCTSHRQQ